MSASQYFEFAAVDGPISDEGLRYAQSLKVANRKSIPMPGVLEKLSVSDMRDLLARVGGGDGRIETADISTGAKSRRRDEMQQKLEQFRARYPNRPAMLRRIEKL